MIKKQQKWVAWLVVLTFAWLLQVSAMPLAASGASEKIASSGSEQGPEFYEAVSPKAAPAPKKSIVPMVLIGVGVVAIAAVLVLVVFKTTYDITGTWDFVFTSAVITGSEEFKVSFTGTKKSGNWAFVEDPKYNGTYAVDGKKFTTTLAASALATEFYGEFQDKEAMTGIWVIFGNTWNFTAKRSGTTAAMKPAPARHATPFVQE